MYNILKVLANAIKKEKEISWIIEGKVAKFSLSAGDILSILKS